MFFGFQDKVSLCSLGCPGTPSVDQVGLQTHRDLPPSAHPPECCAEIKGGVHCVDEVLLICIVSLRLAWAT